MKITLTQQESISLLALNGTLDALNIKVIEAGIHKLFRNGKNRMVVDLRHTLGLNNDFIRNFSIMNIYSRELAGELVLLVATMDEKKKAESFSNPRSILVFANLEEAIQSFRDPKEAQGEAGAAGAGNGDSMEILKQKDHEIRDLKSKLADKEKGEVSTIRHENTRLKELSKSLEENVLKTLLTLRVPTDAAAYQTKVKSLEDRLQKLTEQAGDPKAAGAKK